MGEEDLGDRAPRGTGAGVRIYTVERPRLCVTSALLWLLLAHTTNLTENIGKNHEKANKVVCAFQSFTKTAFQ